VVAFRNGEVLALANLGAEPVELPAGARVVLASGELDAQGRIPADTAAWALI
jgi:alpha-glucosidase